MKPKGCFQVLCGDWVTSDSGTGIVHTSPAFGADDYTTCKEAKIIDPDDPCVTVDDSGYFIDIVSDYKGKYIKDCDSLIVKDLKT